ncbi:MAG TPA: 5-dehydro-2-deoxygluconokinase [Gaiellaceae bacterium]|jgi:5-dehydro-2-deoxygluconokinase
MRRYDTLHMGRSSIDLYSNDVGAPFPEITGFAAYVGGSPTNISVGARRLGLRTALLTGIGDDPVGDFVLRFLEENAVDTQWVLRKPGRRTSAVLLGIEPPDRFPLVFYRDNCADVELTIDDVLTLPLDDVAVFQFAGTNLSREPSRSATIFAAERARASGARTVLDLDFRPDQWHDARAYGAAVRSALRLVDVALGTVDELNAAMLADPADVQVEHSQVSDAHVAGDVEAAVKQLLELGPEVVLEKRGADGARVWSADGRVDVPGFPVEVQNILGAGDAFAAGFLYGYVNGWEWYRAARLGNACGAVVVGRHGCANFMPSLDEATALAEEHGGL